MEEQISKSAEQVEQQWHHVVTVDDLGGLKRKVGVTYDADAVKMAFDKAVDGMGKHVMINGFRRGKAPRSLVAKFCAKEIEAAAGSMLAQEGYFHAVYEHKLSALTEPKVENPEFHTDGTFTCEILVEVRPSITPIGYIGMKLSHPPVDPVKLATDIMNNLREKFANPQEREIAAAGMTVVVDYEVVLEGKELMAHKGVPLNVSSQGRVALGDAHVAGLGIDGETTAHMVLPAEFQEHGGKEADIRLKVRQILENSPPTDEELASRNGLGSAAELNRLVQQQANNEAGKMMRQYLEAHVVDVLLGTHEFEVPEEWIERESQYLVKGLGISGEMDENTKNAVRDMSQRNVKRSFMLDAIYDAEPGLKVKTEEIEAFLDKESVERALPKSQLKRMLVRQGMMDNVVEFIKGKKIMDFLISNAEVVAQGPEGAPQKA